MPVTVEVLGLGDSVDNRRSNTLAPELPLLLFLIGISHVSSKKEIIIILLL